MGGAHQGRFSSVSPYVYDTKAARRLYRALILGAGQGLSFSVAPFLVLRDTIPWIDVYVAPDVGPYGPAQLGIEGRKSFG